MFCTGPKPFFSFDPFYQIALFCAFFSTGNNDASCPLERRVDFSTLLVYSGRAMIARFESTPPTGNPPFSWNITQVSAGIEVLRPASVFQIRS
jgi:hypothetical protein